VIRQIDQDPFAVIFTDFPNAKSNIGGSVKASLKLNNLLTRPAGPTLVEL